MASRFRIITTIFIGLFFLAVKSHSEDIISGDSLELLNLSELAELKDYFPNKKSNVFRIRLKPDKFENRFSLKLTRSLLFHHIDELQYDRERRSRQSINFVNSSFSAGWGYGKTHIAYGFIMGYELMGFTPSIRSNYSLRPVKVGINNHFYYDELHFIHYERQDIHFGYIEQHKAKVFTIEFPFRQHKIGTALYQTDAYILENWMKIPFLNRTFNLNYSIKENGLNHLYMNYSETFENVNLAFSFLNTSQNYLSVHPDTKWGSGLKAGMTGFSAGIRFRMQKGIQWQYFIYRATSDLNEFSGIMSNISYKVKPYLFNLYYTYRFKQDIEEADEWPYSEEYYIRENDQIKIRIRYSASKKCTTQTGMFASFLDSQKGMVFIKQTYHYGNITLRAQYARVQGGETRQYFLRPYLASNYQIASASHKESILDISLSYSREEMDISFLLSQSTETFRVFAQLQIDLD